MLRLSVSVVTFLIYIIALLVITDSKLCTKPKIKTALNCYKGIVNNEMELMNNSVACNATEVQWMQTELRKYLVNYYYKKQKSLIKKRRLVYQCAVVEVMQLANEDDAHLTYQYLAGCISDGVPILKAKATNSSDPDQLAALDASFMVYCKLDYCNNIYRPTITTTKRQLFGFQYPTTPTAERKVAYATIN